MPAHTRHALIDCTKGLACAAIVWHHLAFYGPMSDAARPVMAGLLDWLYEYARMAVQIFLVLGGYLAAASLAPDGRAGFGSPWPRVGKRFVRLIAPYAVALAVTIVVSALIRPWFDHDSVSDDPDLWQLLAHALLLQGVLGQESLSAGVWYVAIDFQLYTLSVLLFASVRAASGWMARRGAAAHGPVSPHHGERWEPVAGRALVAAGVAASLLGFNRDPGWDAWAVYFFGAYGLGMMAFWAVRADGRAATGWRLLMAALVALALAIQWRDRIALAGVTALLLVAAMRTPGLRAWQGIAPLRWLGRISYSVFLIHFSVCLLVNAVVTRFWPGSAAAGVLGMGAAFVLSLAAGRWLYQAVERHVQDWQDAWRWQGGLVGIGLLTAMLAD